MCHEPLSVTFFGAISSCADIFALIAVMILTFDRLALQEILQEAKRGEERYKELGATGW